MSMLALTVLFILAYILKLLRRRRASWMLGLLALSLFVAISSGFLPMYMLRALQVYKPLTQVDWRSKNTIVLLGSGTSQWPCEGCLSSGAMSYSRIYTAARLYFDCKSKGQQCRIIPSGGNPQRHSLTEADVMRRELTQIGVADTDIQKEDTSLNTFQNAQHTSALLQTSPTDVLILVTSGTHMPRSLRHFAQFGYPAIPAPADYLEPKLSWLPLTYNFLLTDISCHELLGMGRLYLYNALGWNKPLPTKAP